jgi:ribosomal protein S18 acetylase RimI-like enzyme
MSADQPSFRQAVEADVPFLLLLRERTMVTHQLASGVPHSAEERERRVRARFDSAQIILLSGEPIGMLKVIREGAVWELLQIQLTPERQGAGWGTRIVRGLIADARRAGVPLRLSVLRANPARHLYERLGFIVAEEGPHSYEMQLSPGGRRCTER